MPQPRNPVGYAASQRGTAAVEFALVLAFVLALVQVGLLVRDRLLVESAVRSGARERYRHLCPDTEG